jgi:signal transduction histidine kinase
VSNQVEKERGNTDESLRAEREKTDQALVDRQTVADENADETVETARSVADAVVATARVRVDNLLHAGRDEKGRLPSTVLAEQRAAEDDAQQRARAGADAATRTQREENARILAALLPLERQKTDRYLLTERARADDAVANRDSFLGIVTHDLRDLLSGIVLSAALLPDGAEPDGTKRRIQRYAARMNRLIGDLADVASIDAGQLKVLPAPSNWSALVEEVVALFLPSASAQGITLEVALARRSFTMRFDYDRMSQVLANLIANSLKFTASGGRILVAVEYRTDELRCAVHDTGSGIPAQLLEAIFQRFWQVRNDDRRGLGLGLYITRCIVEAHGGRIWAESTEGVGSTLRFSVPILE